MSSWVLLVWLLGCKASDDQTPKTGDTPVEPDPPITITPWEYDGGEIEGDYDQASIEEAIQAALNSLLGITGMAPLTAYSELMATADEACPIYSEYEGSVYWYGGCTTNAGVTYEGYSFYETHEDAPIAGPNSSLTGAQLNTQGAIMLADGSRFDMGGSTHVFQGRLDETVEAWMTAVNGTFGGSAVPTDDSWMGGPIRPTIDTTAYRWTYEGDQVFRGLSSTAALTGLSSDWDTVFLSEVQSFDSLFGYWPCPQEVVGTISVRSPSGQWHEVVYDITPGEEENEWNVTPGECDGCGTVYADGRAVGEACNDFSVLRDWEDQPW